MKRKTRKTIILLLKVTVALALLVWVLGREVHLRDYVRTVEGETFAVLAEYGDADPPAVGVERGGLWWSSEQRRSVTDFEPVVSRGAGGEVRIIRAGLLTTVAGTRVMLLLAAFGAFFVLMLILACRWRMLLRIQDVHIGVWEAVRLTFLGQFFNHVVPGTVGGDLVKAYYVSGHTTRKAAVLVSVFVDRLMGLTELTLMSGVMILIVLAAGLKTFDEVFWPVVCVAVVVVVIVVLTALLLSKGLRKALHLQRLYRRLPIAHHVEAAGDAANLYRARVGSLVRAVLITLGAHVFFVGSIALAGLSLSLETPWYAYFMYVPLIYIIGAVPITPGGIGLIEECYRLFFVTALVTPSEVVALAMFARLIPIFWGLPGIVVAVTGPRMPRIDTMEAELGMETASR